MSIPDGSIWQKRLGEVLVASGVISDEQLARALDHQVARGGKLGEILVRDLVLTEDEIAQALAQQKGLQLVNLAVFPVDRTAASLIPERLARRRLVIGIGFEDAGLLLAMADPLDIETVDDVRLTTGMKVIPVVGTPSQIVYAIDKFITSADAFQELASETSDLELESIPDDIRGEDVPVVRIVNQIIREAIAEGASDIHLEPDEDGVRVRYRIDGVLTDFARLPRSAKAGSLSRLKIMADMDIAERRRPQDGRIAIGIENRQVDLRVATLPTPYGESIVIRILDSELSFRSLTELGLGERQLEMFRRFIARPYGAILIAGPTGAGKTTTLYAALMEVNSPSRKIITVEDPIEYRMDGVTQVAVNLKIGLTFASGLRTILRSDPDVVMIGEMRDPETAEIAIRGALTGHLVLTSLHTNNAPASLTRLSDMGVPPYITSSSVIGVVAQRLVRKLCPACKEPVNAAPETLLSIGFPPDELDGLTIFGPVGCERCSKTGYRGRIGVFEVMEVTDSVVRAYLACAPVHELRALAVEAGMLTMGRDALDKVAAGETSLEETARAVV